MPALAELGRVPVDAVPVGDELAQPRPVPLAEVVDGHEPLDLGLPGIARASRGSHERAGPGPVGGLAVDEGVVEVEERDGHAPV